MDPKLEAGACALYHVKQERIFFRPERFDSGLQAEVHKEEAVGAASLFI
jgi:hypothetical protein